MTYRCPACGSTQPHGDSNTVVAGSRFHDRPSPAGQPCPCPRKGADTEPKETPFDDEETTR